MESILDSIKKLIGIEPDYDVFDMDLIIHINSVFGILAQIGIGPEKGFSIVDNSAEWDDFLPLDDARYSMARSYVMLKVRQLFDPPTGAAAEAANKLIAEFEWRLSILPDEKEI